MWRIWFQFSTNFSKFTDLNEILIVNVENDYGRYVNRGLNSYAQAFFIQFDLENICFAHDYFIWSVSGSVTVHRASYDHRTFSNHFEKNVIFRNKFVFETMNQKPVPLRKSFVKVNLDLLDDFQRFFLYF